MASHNRGFTGMNPQKQHDIAGKRSQSGSDEKRNFPQDRKVPAAAGRKDGLATAGDQHRSDGKHDANRGSFIEDRERAEGAGRRGDGRH